MSLPIFLLACYGSYFILAKSQTPVWYRIRDQLEKLQFFRDLFSCPICTGFWVGCIIYTLSNPSNLLLIPVFGAASSAFCYLVERALSLLDEIPALFAPALMPTDFHMMEGLHGTAIPKSDLTPAQNLTQE